MALPEETQRPSAKRQCPNTEAFDLSCSSTASSDTDSSSSDSENSMMFPSDFSSDGSPAFPSDEEEVGENIEDPQCLLATCDTEGENELKVVASILIDGCCDKNCLLHLSPFDVMTTRRKFKLLGANAQRQWLLDKVHENSCAVQQGKLKTKYIVVGKEICQTAWCRVISISSKRLARLAKCVADGHIFVEHGNKVIQVKVGDCNCVDGKLFPHCWRQNATYKSNSSTLLGDTKRCIYPLQ